MSDLGRTVRRCPLASTVVGGDCYSLGYPAARESVSRGVAWEVVSGAAITADVACSSTPVRKLPCGIGLASRPWRATGTRQRLADLTYSHLALADELGERLRFPSAIRQWFLQASSGLPQIRALLSANGLVRSIRAGPSRKRCQGPRSPTWGCFLPPLPPP